MLLLLSKTGSEQGTNATFRGGISRSISFFYGQAPASKEPSPLKFVIVNGDRAGDMLVIEHATRKTTMMDIVDWMSSDSANSEEGAVSFFFEYFGKTQYFPLQEQPWTRQIPPAETGWTGAPGPDNLVCNFLCTEKTIPVSMTRWSNAHMEKKSLTLVLSNWRLVAAYRQTNFYAMMATLQSADCTAPEWRQAEPGLCLEGKSTNVDCCAHGSMVIVNIRYRDYDLNLQYDRCRCPL